MSKPHPTTEKMAYLALLDVDAVARRVGQKEKITAALLEAISAFHEKMTRAGRPSAGLQFEASTRSTPAIGSNSWLNAVWLHLPQQENREAPKDMLFVPNTNPKAEPWLISQGRLPVGTRHETKRDRETMVHSPDPLSAVALLATRQVEQVWMLERDAEAVIPEWMIHSNLWRSLGIREERIWKNFMRIKRSFIGLS